MKSSTLENTQKMSKNPAISKQIRSYILSLFVFAHILIWHNIGMMNTKGTQISPPQKLTNLSIILLKHTALKTDKTVIINLWIF